MRPVILNGIEEVTTRGDLMQRALIVELPAIAPDQRRAERDFWGAFGTARPALFGALLDALAAGLRGAPHVRLPSLPRMADFAEWSVAVEQGLGWPAGGFLSAYAENIAGAHELMLDTSPVAFAVRALVAGGDWTGTVAELLVALGDLVEESAHRRKGWPATPTALGGALRRLAPNLRAVGVEVTFLERTRRGRPVRLAPTSKAGKTASPASPLSPGAGAGDGAGVAGDGGDAEFRTLNVPAADEADL